MDEQHDAVQADVVEFRSVSRRFGHVAALDDVTLSVAPGTVMGLVGENGAGKTTLIKHVLGLLRPDDGIVRTFGADPVSDPVGVLSRIGYLSEEADLPVWMRVRELMRYAQAFYPTWDEAYAEQMRGEFGLDADARLRSLSKGQRARAGLLVALAYRPDLLVLDEPSSGLDPMVRRDILGAVVRTIAEEGRTVLFSSHLLSEVERVCDQVALMHRGRIVFCSTLDEVKERHSRVTLRFPDGRSTAPALDGALTWEGHGREWTAVYAGPEEQLVAAAASVGAAVVDRACPTLDEIFLAYAGRSAAGAAREG